MAKKGIDSGPNSPKLTSSRGKVVVSARGEVLDVSFSLFQPSPGRGCKLSLAPSLQIREENNANHAEEISNALRIAHTGRSQRASPEPVRSPAAALGMKKKPTTSSTAGQPQVPDCGLARSTGSVIRDVYLPDLTVGWLLRTMQGTRPSGSEGCSGRHPRHSSLRVAAAWRQTGQRRSRPGEQLLFPCEVNCSGELLCTSQSKQSNGYLIPVARFASATGAYLRYLGIGDPQLLGDASLGSF